MLPKLYIVFIFLTLAAFNSWSQDAYNLSKKHSASDLLNDLNYLEQFLVKGHPGLFWYSSKDVVYKLLSEIRSELKYPMTEVAFLRTIAKLNDVIKCSHTDFRPSIKYDEFWLDSVKLLPLNIMKIEGDFYISQNLSGEAVLNKGTKLLAINDVPISEIVNQLLPYIPADGNNQTRKLYALQKGFYRYYSYYINAESKYFNISYEATIGEVKNVLVKGISKELFEKRRRFINSTYNSPISFKLNPKNSVAVLKITTFRNDLIEKEKIVFKNYMDSCFKQIKENKTKNLIIDLRNNGGGYSEYAAVLFSYLVDSAFVYCKNQIVTHNGFIEGIKYDIPATFKDFPNGIIFENNQYKWTKHSILGWRQPSNDHFIGNIYFLINGGCSSTTSEFASLARSMNIGTFVGEEVGGCYMGNTGGILGWIELPHTKIRVRMGMVKYEITNGSHINKQGVLPDYPMNYTIEDIMQGRDLEMAFVLKRINQEMKQ